MQTPASQAANARLAHAHGIVARAYRLMELREATVAYVMAQQAKMGRPLRKKRRLNRESAIRRNLVGAKGLRP